MIQLSRIRTRLAAILPEFLLATLVLFTGTVSCTDDFDPKTDKIRLRSDYLTISKAEAKEMVIHEGYFDKYWNDSGDFDNRYESKTIEDAKVVIDHTTGLIWHQSGSEDLLNSTEANDWLSDLNASAYAGQTTWRLPTLEEALSMLENRKKNGNLYIDDAFDQWQWCILTGDSLDSHRRWLVAFSGRIDWFDSDVSLNYVRPVCSQ